MPVLVNNGRKFKWTLCGKLKLNYEFRPRKIGSLYIWVVFSGRIWFLAIFAYRIGLLVFYF